MRIDSGRMESAVTVQKTAPKRKGAGRHKLTGPGPGRPKGLPNRVTQSIKEAIEAATRPGACHPQGLTGWLIERAQGGVADRQIFAGMVSKALPLQVQAQGGGGVTINLGWLAGRQLVTVNGTATSHSQPNLLIQQDDTRTINPQEVSETAGDHQADNHGAAEGDPLPPSRPPGPHGDS